MGGRRKDKRHWGGGVAVMLRLGTLAGHAVLTQHDIGANTKYGLDLAR